MRYYMLPGIRLDITERACSKALSDNTVRSEVVLNLISRELDPPEVEPASTPESICLKEEPLADCSRYDALCSEVCHASS